MVEYAQELETQEAAAVGGNSNFDLRNLPKNDILAQKEYGEKLGEIVIERMKNYDVDKWINMSDKMVRMMNSFPEWNGPVINAFDTVFTTALDKFEPGSDERQEFVNRWTGWVGEALIRREYDELRKRLPNAKLPPMYTSDYYDKNGADTMVFVLQPGEEAGELEGYYIFMSVKTSQNVGPSINIKDINEVGLYEQIDENGGEVSDFVDLDKYNEHRADGDNIGRIYRFCQKEARRLNKEFLRKNKGRIDPRKHTPKMVIGLAAVGAEAQDNDPEYGWKDTMEMVARDKHTGGNKLLSKFGNQLFALMDTADEV